MNFELQARGGRIRELEEELRVVKAELQQEKEEKVDLVTEKVRGVGGCVVERSCI